LLRGFFHQRAKKQRFYLILPTLIPEEPKILADNHLIELAIAGNTLIIVTNNIKDLKQGELHFPSH